MARNGRPPLSTKIACADFSGSVTTSQRPTFLAPRRVRVARATRTTSALKIHRRLCGLGTDPILVITPLYVASRSRCRAQAKSEDISGVNLRLVGEPPG